MANGGNAHKGPLLFRSGTFVFRHHRWFALLWVAILVVAGYWNATNSGATSNNFSVPGTDSQAAYDLLGKRFASQNAATATVVVRAPTGATLA